jgi:molybdopterin-guanine dinucleotide biosynthesis protein A
MSMRLAGLVLAGGESVRMGRDKARLPFGKDSLAAWMLQLLEQSGCERAFLSLRPGQEIPAGVDEWRVLRDPTPEPNGPMAGLLSALQAVDCDWLLTVPVDMPCLRAAFLRRLVRSGLQGPGPLIASVESRIEPLVALYPREVSFNLFRAAWASGERSLQRVLSAENSCRFIDCREQADEGQLANLNDPAAWDRFLLSNAGMLQGREAGSDSCKDRT